MSYRWNMDRVLWPEMLMATVSGTPARTMSRNGATPKIVGETA
ncbi:MAG: hypothetical protein WCC46_18770 [Terriglobales bacterium]